MALLEQHGSDGVRYWAAGGRAGVDTAFDESQMKVGRRLATKVLNVGRFVLGFGGTANTGGVTAPIDASLLAALATVVDEATIALDGYEWTRALEAVERVFWRFCDDYVELVKGRAYDGDASAVATLTGALDTLLRLLAPFLPFVTEEVWSWWHTGSVHREPWPVADGYPGDPLVFDVASDVIGAVRKAKSAAQRSLRAPVALAVVHDSRARLDALDAAVNDVRGAGGIVRLDTAEAGEFSVSVELAPEE